MTAMTMTDDEIAWLKAIAKRVKVARVEHDLSQADLAGRASLTRNKISAIERSAEILKLYEINRIARAVGIELADLVDGAP
jgi:transcriptional regulator with XRE-family HTH domain